MKQVIQSYRTGGLKLMEIPLRYCGENGLPVASLESTTLCTFRVLESIDSATALKIQRSPVF